MRCATTLLVLFASTSVFAVDPDAGPQPKSLAAKSALSKYERTMKEAEATYRKACTDATTKAIEELTKAQKEAMTNQNLREANLIDDKILDLKDSLKKLLDAEKVPARSDASAVPFLGRWQFTLNNGWKGVYLIDGKTIRIEGGNASQVTTYEYQGSEMRLSWPNGDTGHIVFDGDTLKLEFWGKGQKAFEGTPTRTGNGKRL